MRMSVRRIRFWRDRAPALTGGRSYRQSIGRRTAFAPSLPQAVQNPGTDPVDQGFALLPHHSAVLAADVVGYSRMVELNPRDSIFRLRTMRHDLIEPVARAHGVRLVRYAGDSVLAEFPCVPSAVIFAIEVQRGLPELEKHVPEDRRIRLRIGISSGYVFIVDDDLHGTSVNIASRLQALAAPGDIYLSEVALKQTQGRLAFRCQSLGKRQLKNIVAPVHVFRIPMEEVSPDTVLQDSA